MMDCILTPGIYAAVGWQKTTENKKPKSKIRKRRRTVFISSVLDASGSKGKEKRKIEECIWPTEMMQVVQQHKQDC